MTEPTMQVLFHQDAIVTRIHVMRAQILEHYSGGQPPMVVVCAKGAREFARHLNLPWHHHEIRASSYSGQESTGHVEFDLSGLDVDGRDVLIIEDIVDSGLTLSELELAFAAKGADNIGAAVLLQKESAPVRADWVGFDCPEEFVIGFGMDLDGKYRELPHIFRIIK